MKIDIIIQIAWIIRNLELNFIPRNYHILKVDKNFHRIDSGRNYISEQNRIKTKKKYLFRSPSCTK